MPRQPKPFPHQGWYKTNLGGQRRKLCRIEEGTRAADIALARLLVERADAAGESKTPGPGIKTPEPDVGPLVHALLDEYLDVVKVEKSPRTYKDYRDELAPFHERFGNQPVATLTYQDGIKYKKWLKEEKEWKRGKGQKGKGLGPVSVNHKLRAAKIFLNWCAKPERAHIPVSPWKALSLLLETPRERLMTDEEFKVLLDNCTNGNEKGGAKMFKQILRVMRGTTFRPGELRLLKWDYIQWEHHRIVFPATVIKTRSRRASSLLPIAEDALKERLEAVKKKTGFVFPGRNQEGKRDPEVQMNDIAFSRRFGRLRKRCVKLGLIEEEKNGERLVLYSNRHTRITNMYIEGNDTPVVMAESGHKTYAMAERYKHLAPGQFTDLVRQRAAAHSGSGDRQAQSPSSSTAGGEGAPPFSVSPSKP
jgi:integrase